jgi:hypothetical protein
MIRSLAGVAFAVSLAVASAGAQTSTADLSDKLRQVLPEGIRERVIAKIAEARSRGLPAEALEQRALKFAARGVKPEDIERSVNDHSARMERVSQVLEQARARRPSDQEVDAGAEAMRKGVNGQEIAAVAKSAPSGRSLEVPFQVISSLVDRGLPSDEALERVQGMLHERRTDAELERLPGEVGGKPALTGRELADTKRPEGVGRPAGAAPPAGVPANPGAGARPGVKPPIPQRP